VNGRKAKQARRLAAELREAGFDAPLRARRLRPWLERHYGLTAHPAPPVARRRPGPPSVAEYQPLGSRKITGRHGPTRPGRERPADRAAATRQARQARKASWRARRLRRRQRRQQQQREAA